MKFETTFDIGDKGWVYLGVTQGPQQVTIGQIRVEHTDSKGCSLYRLGDNYKPQKGHKEQYMCEETGIGSGTVYTLGEHIFKTEQECAERFAEVIKQREEEQALQKQYEREEKLRREATLRAQLAEIERIKAEGV